MVDKRKSNLPVENHHTALKFFYMAWIVASLCVSVALVVGSAISLGEIKERYEWRNRVAFFAQSSPEWENVPYGSCDAVNILGEYGCGPASLAMIISTLPGTRITPDVIADRAVEEGIRFATSDLPKRSR